MRSVCFILVLAFSLSGCLATSLVSTAVEVTGSAASATIGVTGAIVETGIDLATPEEPEQEGPLEHVDS